MRKLVAGGECGAVRRVMVKYTQDWLSRPEDLVDNKQAEWRVDPARSGDAGAFGDIGTHAANLVEFITGERIAAICAELTMLPGRRIDLPRAYSPVGSNRNSNDASSSPASIFIPPPMSHWGWTIIAVFASFVTAVSTRSSTVVRSGAGSRPSSE